MILPDTPRRPGITTSASARPRSSWPDLGRDAAPSLTDGQLPPPLLAGLDSALERRSLSFIDSTLRLLTDALADLRTVASDEVSPVAAWTPAHAGENAEYSWLPSAGQRTTGVRKLAGLAHDLMDLEKQLRKPVADLVSVLDLVADLHAAGTYPE